MKRSAIARLKDMLRAIDAAAEMCDGVDFATYRSDIKLRFAVERCVEIVSEASRHVPEEAKARFPETPWPEIAAIGNKLRHEYNRLDDAIVWSVVRRGLPELRPVIAALIAQAENDAR